MKRRVLQNIKKLIITLFTFYWLSFSFIPAYAQDATSIVPTPPAAPTAPTPPPAPSPSDTPTPPPAPTAPPVSDPTDSQPTPAPTPAATPLPSDPPGDNGSDPQSSPTPAPSSNPDTSSSGVVDNGNSGDTVVTTGDATNTATVVNVANTNQASTPSQNGSGSQADIAANGSDSTNTAVTEQSNSAQTVQDNTARVGNDLNLKSTTGDNSTSFNTNGDSVVFSGDANVHATVLNTTNTNLDGVGLAHFTVADNHTGDLVLIFDPTNTFLPAASSSAVVNGNGTGSDTTTATVITDSNATFQTNDAHLQNGLTLEADSGSNQASYNTGGDSVVKTGDANVSANVVNMANNNFAGNVVVAVVDIFGDLIGDIILPIEAFTQLFGSTEGNTSQNLAGNGSGSTNTAVTSGSSDTTVFQTNEADIGTTIDATATTGDNKTSANTGGNSVIKTGDADVVLNTATVANNNLEGGNFWLVLVNEAGKWIGKIFGSSDGSTSAGSELLSFNVDGDGNVVPEGTQITGNGSDSQNTVSNTENTDSTTTQSNTANVQNTLNLKANTGGNSASYNTGGDSYIETGDAKIVANVVNFVNNNIASSGKLIVTVINVFGSWLGDFLPPGFSKPKETVSGQTESPGTGTGGATVSSSENSGNNEESQNTVSLQSEEESLETVTSTTPAPKIIFTKPKVITRWFSNSDPKTQGTSGEEEGSQPTSSTDDAVLAAQDEANTVEVNLAWLVMAIPLIGLSLVTKNKWLLVLAWMKTHIG